MPPFTADALERCPGCGLALPPIDGPTDPYAGASPSCWAMYGEILACGPGRTVDAYMAQHPGYATAAGRRSVVVHLVGLCLWIEKGAPPDRISRLLGLVLPGKPDVPALLPMPEPGALTVASVHRAHGGPEHAEAVLAWARSVWHAWAPHHDQVRSLAELVALRASAAPRPHRKKENRP